MTDRATSDMVVVGRIGAPHGVRGWMRLTSYTDPAGNLVSYQPLWLRRASGWAPLQHAQIKDESSPGRPRFLIRLPGIDDRDAAQLQRGLELAIAAQDLPATGADSFYWRELVGLRAVAPDGHRLGQIREVLDTPVHAVLVLDVASELAAKLAIDPAEVLIPFVNDFTQDIDLEMKTIVIDWPEVFFPELS